MRKLLMIALTLVLMQATGPVFAAPVWSNNVTILAITGDVNITVYFAQVLPNPGSCTKTNVNTVSWESISPASKNFMSMMLTAKAANLPVQVLVDDSSCLWGGWRKLLSMRLL